MNFDSLDKFSFINAKFNFSYNNQYEVNYDSLEKKLTNLLIKNKKLLTPYIFAFIYAEVITKDKFQNELTFSREDYITDKFKSDDKEIINKLKSLIKSNKNIYKRITDNFINRE